MIKRTNSRELRGGVLYASCECVRRNGLQHDCPRTGCQGKPECLQKPFPCCNESIKGRCLQNMTMGTKKPKRKTSACMPIYDSCCSPCMPCLPVCEPTPAMQIPCSPWEVCTPCPIPDQCQNPCQQVWPEPCPPCPPCPPMCPDPQFQPMPQGCYEPCPPPPGYCQTIPSCPPFPQYCPPC